MKTRHPAGAPGFTLIEVLVALVIVAFGMSAVLAALTGAANNTMRQREATFAAWVGFNQLATERLKVALPAIGTKEGDVEFAGSRWHWLQTVTDMEAPGVKRIMIQVRPAGDAAASDSWAATVMGFRGDALQSPLDVIGGWDNAGGPPPPPQPGG